MSQYQLGTEAPWYQGREISEEERASFRAMAVRSREAKLKALAGEAPDSLHPVNMPAFVPSDLMPQVGAHGLSALSLFSGGGGLDLGFDLAGFGHIASFDTLEAAGRTLTQNRPDWKVHSGADGDVRSVDWRAHRGADIPHRGAA